MKEGKKFLIGAGVILIPVVTQAAGWAVPTQPTDAPTSFDGVVMNATNWILGFVTMIAVLMIIWGGVQYLTSAGNQDQARSAKDTLKFALMGLVVAGIAYALVNVIVTNILGTTAATTV